METSSYSLTRSRQEDCNVARNFEFRWYRETFDIRLLCQNFRAALAPNILIREAGSGAKR